MTGDTTVDPAAHSDQIRWHQGITRFIVELCDRSAIGLPMAQIADVEWGRLYPPQPIDSILARGYWELLDTPVATGDVLAKVQPAG